MNIRRPLLICGIAAFAAALTIGIPITAPKRGPRPFLTGEPQMVDLLKMRNYPANIELIDTPCGERVSVSRRTEAGNETALGGTRNPDTFIVR